MTKVLIATDKPFAPVAVKGIKKIIEDAGFQCLLLEKYKTKQELIDAVKDVDAIIIRSDIIDKEVIDAAPDLKIVVRAGAGYDNIDLKAATEKKVVAMNTPGQNSNAVAELALGMMVYFARGCFNGASGFELKDKKLGIHAYGNVGKNIARIAKGFGMEVFAFDPFVTKASIEADGVKVCDNLEDMYKTCNYISLNMPANDKTKKSINYALMSKMPENAVIVNTARKEVINEEDLLKIMGERKDFGYVADVEPDNKAVFEEKFKGKYYFTPKKMGAQTEEANINAGLAAAKQIVNFIKNGDATFKVN